MEKKNNISEEWLAEIVRETDHYYQGEMQQEARASWLLSTNSALIVLVLSFLDTNVKNNQPGPQLYMVFLLVFLLAGSVSALIALMPFRWTKLFRSKTKRNSELTLSEFVNSKFRPDSKWSSKSLEERTFHHFRSHFIRNQKKSYFVMISSVSLMLTIIVLMIIYFS